MNITLIISLLLLAAINVPFALSKNNKASLGNWMAIGFQFGLLAAHIINNL